MVDPSVSFGGYKQSGFGRELGAHSMEAYTQVKSVWLNLK
jgi:aldehyde dehydrogenase (NAD+)